MDWFRSGVRRNKETVLQAVGHHQATEDSAFEKKYSAFLGYILDLEHVSDSLQLYVESLDMYNASLLCMGRAFKRLHSGNNSITGAVQYQMPSKMETVADIFSTINKDIDVSLGINIKASIVSKCIEPILSVLALVPPIDKKVEKRKQLLLDYDFYKAKLQQEHQYLANSQSNSLMRNSTRDAIADSYTRVETKLQETMKDLADLQIELEVEFEEFDSARASMLSNELSNLCAGIYGYSMGTGALYSNMFTLLPGSHANLTELVSQTGITAIPPEVLVVQHKDKRKQSSTHCLSSAATVDISSDYDGKNAAASAADDGSTDDNKCCQMTNQTPFVETEPEHQSEPESRLSECKDAEEAATAAAVDKTQQQQPPLHSVSLLSTSQQTFVKLQYLMHQQLMINIDAASGIEGSIKQEQEQEQQQEHHLVASSSSSGSGYAAGSSEESKETAASSSSTELNGKSSSSESDDGENAANVAAVAAAEHTPACGEIVTEPTEIGKSRDLVNVTVSIAESTMTPASSYSRDAILAAAKDTRSSALLKTYVVNNSIARPAVLGGITGGYELLPSLYSQKMSRNSISRTPGAGVLMPPVIPPPVPKKPRVVLRTSITGAVGAINAAGSVDAVVKGIIEARDPDAEADEHVSEKQEPLEDQPPESSEL